MPKKLGVIMDPIDSIKMKQDTTLAILLEAQARGWELLYFEQKNVYLRDGIALGAPKGLTVQDDPTHWFSFQPPMHDILSLSDLDVIFFRVDPPFNQPYLYTTYLLDLAEQQGAFVINKPQSVRDCNEKIFTAWFPDCCAPALVSQDTNHLKAFLERQVDIVVKPLDNMGGKSIFRVTSNDPNVSVILETLTQDGTVPIMAQRYIPEIITGDKRILLINGEPYPYALNRIPKPGETRANLVAGGTGIGAELTERDRFICEQLGPTLKAKGLFFVGIDVIGQYLTEINVTCPTCVRQIDAAFGVNVCATLFDALESELTTRLL